MRTFALIALGIVLFAMAMSVTFWYAYSPAVGGESNHKELLIYCGITMIKPVAEIARIIEKQEDCRILVTKGGSGNLLHAIEINRAGDLYLPGSDSYIKTCVQKGLVNETALVGFNKAAIMVQKGNPKGITADLANLANPDYYVVIGAPNSGSIGRETQRILQKRGIYEAVAHNARMLTTDSKDLVKVLRDKEADVVINWYATSTWPENAPYVEALGIDERYATPKTLVLGLLTCSRHPEIAKKFIEYASSPEGVALFRQYGLYDVK